MNKQRIAVLVDEDEIFIRMDITAELELGGFDVFEASNSEEAIAMLVANTHIQLLFTDVDMPGGVDGLKLAASVRDRWPPIKIIVTSGHRRVNVENLPVEARFVPKPYSPAAVIVAMREMLAPCISV